MKALVTGASGIIGKALQSRLDNPRILSRNAERAKHDGGPTEVFQWQPEDGPPPAAAFDGVEAVFHLAGEPVAGRWSAARKRRIRDSRVIGTRHLVDRLAQLESRPRVLVCASAVGYYGDRGDDILDESSAAGDGYLAEVCSAWEREAMRAETFGIRVVCVRIGVVLAPDGGALARMITPFKMGAGGRLGNGKQWMSWVHVDDVVGIMLHASCDDISGAVNAVAPNPVSNAEFTRALGKALHRPTLFPVPRAALRLAFGEMSEILLASQRVLPRAAQTHGYRFAYPQLDAALGAATTPPSTRSAA